MLDTRKVIHSDNNLFILVGKNGSGKSCLLRDLAENTHGLGYNVMAVSNTLFDKFEVHLNSFNYDYIGSRLGRNFPAQAIKRTLSTESGDKIKRIFTVLGNIGYEQEVGIKIKFRRKFKNTLRYSNYLDYTEKNIPEGLEMAIEKAIYQTGSNYNDIIWLTIDDNVFHEGSFSSYLTLLRNEKLLKKANIISGIEVFLNKNKDFFPLSEASSGELSFIALLVHITFCVTNNSFIFIDEPENSLHPEWQRTYFDLLKGAIGYNQVKVVVATHSPLIITSISGDEKFEIYKRGRNDFNKVDYFSDNAEELYIDYFDTLTPKNRALSNRCVDIIDQLDSGEISLDSANKNISKFINMTDDEAQKNFLKGVNKLLEKVNNKKGMSNHE
ncbi:AAA family ATPase [Providencia sp. wls1949]|uniref:AAA family ATPase n=1 Tax=Providencia sp. wls1949 TaxID=2675148 RepID=UPI0012B60DD8|nr:ATP-binding protein [Providencia sp. wls1949]MTB39317.1 AAA family ATPase [Providencia sp. wls1949]